MIALGWSLPCSIVCCHSKLELGPGSIGVRGRDWWGRESSRGSGAKHIMVVGAVLSWKQKAAMGVMCGSSSSKQTEA
jgi:hypothetical protein